MAWRTAEKETINILEKHARTRVKVCEIPSQSLSKEMGAVTKTLREGFCDRHVSCPCRGPCKLSGGPGVRVKAKRKYESGYKGSVKKASFWSRTIK